MKYIHLLGMAVVDKVTGFAGIVTSVGYDLYGCVQVVVTPVMKDGKREDSCWFDAHRLEVVGTKPVMEVPDFSSKPVSEAKDKGPADKPPMSRY